MFNKDVVILRVGEKIPMLSGFNGCMMDWLSGTAAYCIVLGAPTVSLQNEVIGSLEKKIRFAKYTSGNVLDLAIKLEGLPWMDAPYTPHLSAVENLPREDGYPDGMGGYDEYPRRRRNGRDDSPYKAGHSFQSFL